MMFVREIDNNYVYHRILGFDYKNKQIIGLEEKDIQRMHSYQTPNGHILRMDVEHARELIERYDANYELVKQNRENSILIVRRLAKDSERHFRFYSCLNHTDYWHCIDDPKIQLAVERP